MGVHLHKSTQHRQHVASQELLEVAPPYSNTGGKFRDRIGHGVETCIIDWLSLSVPCPAFDVPERVAVGDPRVAWLGHVSTYLQLWLGEHVEVRDKASGLFGFTDSAVIQLKQKETTVELGRIAWGGKSQKGRMLISLSGTGCAMVKDWRRVKTFVDQTESRITRLDLAVDYHVGMPIENVVEAYKRGEFGAGGRMPSHSLVGDWLAPGSPKGRTLYVGNRENGKQIRAYEKGKQLGDTSSEWLRLEGEIHNKDRVIPSDALLKPMQYWRGLCEYFDTLANTILQDAAQKIETVQKVAKMTMKHLLTHAQNAYGKLINVLMDCTGEDAETVVELLRRDGVPRRIIHPLAIAGYQHALG